MQIKARKQWGEEEEGRPSFPLPTWWGSQLHARPRGKWPISRREIKDFKTIIKNSPNIVVMASEVYTDVRIYQIVQYNMYSLLYAN